MAPYVKGEQCTQCESGYSCDDGLCGVPSDEGLLNVIMLIIGQS